MKKLTSKQLSIIDRDVNSAQFLYYKMVIQSKFSVGDVLIKSIYDVDAEASETSTYDDTTTGLACRYLVVHIDDDTGIAFVSEYDEDGVLDSDVVPVIDFYELKDDYFHYYEVDPAYVSATILGEEFDIKELFKTEVERKERHVKLRETLGHTFTSTLQVNNFLKDLKPGQKIWMQEDYRWDTRDKMTYSDLNDDYIVDGEAIKSIEPLKKTKKPKKSDQMIVTFSSGDQWTSENLTPYIIYTSKPPELHEQV